MRYLVGIGNYTALDDSIGLRVAETVADEGLDRGFRVLDLAGTLLDLVHYLDESCEEMLIVDSAHMGKAPGEWAFFRPGQVETRKALAGLSSHEGDLIQVLALARSLGRPLPSLTILGIEPETIRLEIGLSSTLAARLQEYVGLAVGFFERPGGGGRAG